MDRSGLDQQSRAAGKLPPCVLEAALHGALEAIPAPAYVVTNGGAIVLANESGREQLAQDPDGVQDGLAAALRPRRATVPLRYVIRCLEGNAERATHFLAVMQMVGRDAGALARIARLRWSLTERQMQVLALLAGGAPNRRIADELSCTVGTVELHVSAILEKAGAESRAEVIARFWQELQ